MWCLVPNKICATLHVVFKDEESYMNSLATIHKFLLKYGINHATVQPEFPNADLTDVQNINSFTNSTKETADEDAIQECQDNYLQINNTPPTEQKPQNCCLLSCPSENCLKKRCCITTQICRTIAQTS